MRPIAELKNLFDEGLAKNRNIAHALNYDLADNPELSGVEYESCRKFVKICREYGMAVEENFAGIPTAFRAQAVRVENPIGRMAILAEYDALPDLGHGCGHSASGSLSLLTALALHEMAEELKVDVDLIGTPDEELHGAKVAMVNEGVFHDYDFAMMIHMNSNTTFPSVRFLALSTFRVKFFGRPTHASATPWEGRNALNGAILAINALDMLRQQVTTDTRISYYIVNGGKASNVIPDFSEIELVLRHSRQEELDAVVERAMNCIKGAALATGTEYEVETLGYPFSDMVLNEPGIDVIRSVMDDLNVPYQEDDGTMLGSSDIGNVSHVCPAFHPMLATSNQYFPLHTQQMVDMMKSGKAKDIIDTGARIIGHTLLTIMAEPETFKKIKEDFQRNTQTQSM
ncbi:amidohydrolase [Bacillus sp. B-jedd]|uniref:amidohydrolase n=1 Tax=Bacillus sp. B-jedd TaxID=1476857 RepID=UPI00051568CE|nr:amidohydrolase [Bacillus sp. B-jedd]CEG29149.1 amidohydrolase [Bacillus sp. B-jedd]